MALNPSNSSNLEQLVVKGLTATIDEVVIRDSQGCLHIFVAVNIRTSSLLLYVRQAPCCSVSHNGLC